AEPKNLDLLAERGMSSLSELVASTCQGSPVTLELTDFGRQLLAERGLARA
ncbi:hypothetical protein A2U01_0104556, partial [Trifolium medium]|nr:hypothetical protein [Trifolium medium]